MADSNRSIEQAIHDRWARMTDEGKLDGRVGDLERACDDFFNQQHGRYNLSADARDHFRLFRALALDDLKRNIVLQPLPSARFPAE